LAYFLGSDYPPRVAFKLNILGMDNCFEACRLADVNRIAYASSLAVSGEQKFYGDRLIKRRFPTWPCAVCDAQNLQRIAGAGLSRKARHGDHGDPPGQCHRT
jgi:nucleoside-diphosphate-sugar epimerase